MMTPVADDGHIAHCVVYLTTCHFPCLHCIWRRAVAASRAAAR
jgi:hypothetical protein